QIKHFHKKRPMRQYAVTDALALLLGIACAYAVTALFGTNTNISTLLAQDNFSGMGEYALLSAAVLLWFQHTDHYSLCMPLWIESRKIVSALALAGLAHGFLLCASRTDLSGIWLMPAWVISAVAMLMLRHRVRRRLKASGDFYLRTLLVG